MTGMYVASNPMALSAQFGLVRNMGALGETLTRLSTGLKINSGKDDPAGLIASELLKSQITGTMKAITNTQRANALIATADSSLGQIGNLLNDIKGLVVEAAQTGTMTAEQIAANQLQVDSALDSIDRIARTTNYGGKKLLDGSLDFRTAGMSGGLGNVKINSANFGTASAIGVNVNVTQAADYARLISNGTGVGVDTTFDVIGNRGSATINVGAGTTNAEIAAAINRSTDSTGVLAYVEGLAARGSVTLSSAGKNNDIVITALNEGFDAGNYSFRITRGLENDARVVQESGPGQAGVIEISLREAYESRYSNFAGLFDIVVDTTNRSNPAGAATSVTMTRGNANNVTYSEDSRNAATNVIHGRSMTASATGTPTSALNGWTVAVDDSIASARDEWRVDTNTKTVYVNSASEDSDVANALTNAMAKTNPGVVTGLPTVSVDFNHGTSNPFVNGDRFTFSGGANAGEVSITYKEGATANEILAMLNNAPNVSASLARGVDGSALIKNLPDGMTQVANTTGNTVSRYSSGATAQEVIDLVNSKLGHLFTASGLTSDGGTGGRVSYMDAAVDYGDVNLGNALRFTGMDNGPIVRLTNLGTNGQPVSNQKLGINVIHPSEADIKAGIHTPVLEIKLATDAQGNSITSARDIVEFFKTLTPEQTMGVSVSQLFAPGVDPNGRIFATGECGTSIVVDTCPTPIDGIVQPTGAPGLCGAQQGDLILLGTNQRIVADNAIARINGNNPILAFSDEGGEAATRAEATVTVSGVEFTLTAAALGNVITTIEFNETSASSWVADLDGGGALVIGLLGYTAATDGDSADSFRDFLMGEIVALTGAPGFTIVHDDDDGTTWTGTPTATAVAAETFAVTEGEDAIPGDAASGHAISGADADAGYNGTLFIDFGQTSAMNGLTFGFTRDETREGFDFNSGTLTIFLGSQFTDGSGSQAQALEMAINDAIAANWESIRAKTGATGDAVRVVGYTDDPTDPSAAFDADAVELALADADAADQPGALPNAGKTTITGSFVEGPVIGQRGVGKDDPVLNIVAKQAGTDMAGISIHFVNDVHNTALAPWDNAFVLGAGYVAGDPLPAILVDFVTKEDGSRELIVTANLGANAASEIDAGLLAKALNANSTFRQLFTANALQLAPGENSGDGTAGSVLFTTDITKHSATTVGGYRIVSDPLGANGASTSSGVGMFGASDSNERLVIESEELGSNSHVAVNVIRGFLNTVDAFGNSSGYAIGSDMVATINGLRATTSGNQISINSPDLSMSMTAANGIGSHGFTITGGGALFQLGPDVVSQQQMRIGIGSMLTSALGGQDGSLFMLRSGEVASLMSNDEGRKLADRIVNQAIQSVASTRGQLGAIQRGSLEPNVLALQDSLVALTEANAMITNADFAVESSNLTRLQLLIQAGAQTLGIANQMPQYAASLIR